MINKPRYKIARRLGANIFDKTQGQKFADREARRKVEKRSHPKSDFGLQMLEKQKAKVTYGVNERMFAKYVKSILDKAGANSPDKLILILESRLDNVIYRLGLAPTRQSARQMVSHGHIKVNDVKVTIPSYSVSLNDKITIKENSVKKGIFANLAEKLKDYTCPSWLTFDLIKNEAKVQGIPKLSVSEANFDPAAVLNFYSR
ncbi:MAG: 30S ribosomal protein S4 [Candidatus Taylorbacteria bacterium RIFOXYD2_FULL_36_9]|uniref:Small ribosomal subunit protein uS4 n=1 Tax=Candidatus Taylorbacteria bacterium RIFOXYD2_FULL_36_9 TaxID=1802338 RepID=A0A1G2PFI0_9BACT|nr:MAG: 30S ribosomal protein S4 [Candidatus Taylorbacteria bacterium RIFOXYD2_FULL_36_9]